MRFGFLFAFSFFLFVFSFFYLLRFLFLFAFHFFTCVVFEPSGATVKKPFIPSTIEPFLGSSPSPTGHAKT